MVQKQAARSRSKSASRKSKSEKEASDIPVVTSRRKSLKTEKESEDSLNVYRRITRQAIRATSCTSLDDWEVDEPIVKLKRDRNERGTNNEIEKNGTSDDERETVNSSCANAILKALVSLFFVIFFPILVIFLNKMCENGGAVRIINLSEIKIGYFNNWIIMGFVFLWLLFLSFLSVLPIGSSRSVSLSDGFKLRYRCNGVLSLTVSIAGLLWLLYSKNLTTKLIYDNYYAIIGSSINLSIIISLLVYLKSYSKTSRLVPNPGNIAYCYLIGREINPRVLGLDLKYFYEFRPGFISWALLNIIYCIKDCEDRNYKSINMSLLLCATCQFFYCFDSLLFEGDVILKSYMVNGRFGFIHCFGSQVIVPFLFTLTSRCIQINKMEVPIQCLTCIAVVNLIGYVIYRTSNSQKNDFRRNPYNIHLSHLRTFTNEHGHQLLAGGWWGLLRHPNYAGDIVMSICWSLCAGSNLLICWLYPIYFVVFITNRCIQDERYCSQKHGHAWQEYKQTVRYRLLPFIF